MLLKRHKIPFWKGLKHCGERRKCWLPAFSPFPIMFSKGIYPHVVISVDPCNEFDRSEIKTHRLHVSYITSRAYLVFPVNGN